MILLTFLGMLINNRSPYENASGVASSSGTGITTSEKLFVGMVLSILVPLHNQAVTLNKKHKISAADPNRIVSILSLKRDEIRLDHRLREDLGLDSMDMSAVQLDISRDLNVDIEDDDLPAIQTVGDLTTYVIEKMRS